MRTPEFIPWLELGPTAAEFAACRAGLDALRAGGVCSAIVSTDPARTAALVELTILYPELHVIPGLKLSPLLGHTGYDAVAAWRDVADAVRGLASPVVVIESESAVREYIVAARPWSRAGLRAGLRLLPRDRQYWWYPTLGGADAAQQRRSAELFADVQAVVTELRPVNHATLYGPRALSDEPAQAIGDALAPHQVLLAYFRGATDRGWSPTQLSLLSAAAEPFEGAPLILYPGASQWGSFCAALTDWLARRSAAAVPDDLTPPPAVSAFAQQLGPEGDR